MRLVSFNFTKINSEKIKSDLEGMKVNSSINIGSIEEPKDAPKSKEAFLLIKWNYLIDYEPNIANFDFAGSLIVSEESKKVKKILKDWEDKKLEPEVNMSILNVIMKKVSIKALQMEDDYGLPSHFKFPSLKINNQQ
jgi:hypothetical protein